MHSWTAITVTHNSAEALRRCWSGFDRTFAWVVVDNASTDGSAALAESLGATVIQQANVGFSRANNRALERVASDYVVFVNPDVVVDPCTLPALEALAARGALVAPQLTFPDGSDQPNARGLPFVVDKLAHRGVRLPSARLASYTPPGRSTPYPVDWVMGAAVAGATDTFRRLGGWDGRYFIYHEDHELGLRAWSRGVPMLVDPTVRWCHEWSRDTARPSAVHWRHEIVSASRFYARYPLLTLPWRGPAERRYGLRSVAARRALDSLSRPRHTEKDSDL